MNLHGLDSEKLIEMNCRIENMTVARPFLRWAGSKRKLLPKLLEAVPPKFERYIEPFAGSACLFYSINPARAILGDINSELINTYSQIKKNVNGVIAELPKFSDSEEAYYQIRALDPDKLSKEKRAARFIYLNRYCFNGLYRTNRCGKFNVPFGGGKSGDLPSPEVLRACAITLQKTKLISGSFEKTFLHVKTDDFVYMDPPYSIKARRVFSEYSHHIFGPDQLRLLKTYLLHFDRIGAKFLVSYGLSNEARQLGKGFNCRQVLVQRQIAGFASQRRKNKELLITNY